MVLNGKLTSVSQDLRITQITKERNMNSFARASCAIALVSLLALPGVALSQDIPGWYIGFGIGQTKFKGACDGVSPGVTCDDTDTAGKVLGGYQFSKNFDLELAYADLGQAKAGSSTFKAKGVEFAGVGMLPIGQQLSLLARGGLFHWNVDATGTPSATGTDLTYGFGLKFDFNRDFAIRAEWQRFKDVGDSNTTGQGNIDFIGASLVYRL
jgi:OmpA-OmpF porin, OOP family